MADGLDRSERYKIASFGEPTLPIGVDFSKVGFQFIYVGAPVYDWQLGDDGGFIINGYSYVGVLDGKVVASINPEQGQKWLITREAEGFTIRLASDPELGWTVQPAEPGKRQEISVEQIARQFFQRQTFLLDPIK